MLSKETPMGGVHAYDEGSDAVAELVIWVVLGIMLWAVVRERWGVGRGRGRSKRKAWTAGDLVNPSAARAKADWDPLGDTDPYKLANSGQMANPLINPLTAPPPLGAATAPVGDPLWPSSALWHSHSNG
jgi:hypothetical protein